MFYFNIDILVEEASVSPMDWAKFRGIRWTYNSVYMFYFNIDILVEEASVSPMDWAKFRGIKWMYTLFTCFILTLTFL